MQDFFHQQYVSIQFPSHSLKKKVLFVSSVSSPSSSCPGPKNRCFWMFQWQTLANTYFSPNNHLSTPWEKPFKPPTSAWTRPNDSRNNLPGCPEPTAARSLQPQWSTSDCRWSVVLKIRHAVSPKKCGLEEATGPSWWGCLGVVLFRFKAISTSHGVGWNLASTKTYKN